MKETIVGMIVNGVVELAKLLFRPKRKRKVTKNKTKEVETFNQNDSINNHQNN